MSADTTPGTPSLIDEAARRRFEAAWRAGQPEPIQLCLPPEDDPPTWPRWKNSSSLTWNSKAKPRWSAPSPISPLSLPESTAYRPSLLKEEFRCRQRRGDQPNMTEYHQRFPDLDLSASIWRRRCAVTVTRRCQPRPTCRGTKSSACWGRGGMGLVYKAKQTRLRRIVAVKQILSGAGATAEDLVRFRTEAQAVARVQHPNIVQVYEVGNEGGRPYLALEFVDGGSLDQKIAGTPMPVLRRRNLPRSCTRHPSRSRPRHPSPGSEARQCLLTADGTPKNHRFRPGQTTCRRGRS